MAEIATWRELKTDRDDLFIWAQMTWMEMHGKDDTDPLLAENCSISERYGSGHLAFEVRDPDSGERVSFDILLDKDGYASGLRRQVSAESRLSEDPTDGIERIHDIPNPDFVPPPGDG